MLTNFYHFFWFYFTQTPLFVAAKHGFLKCVRLLLGHKCDLFTHVRIEGRDVYAWDIALKHGNDDVVKYLNGCVGK